MSKKVIEIKVPADLNLSSMVRTMASDVFRMMRFHLAWSDRLKLVVDELFMNAVKYGSTPEVSDVHIRFLLEEDQIGFQISDDGTGPIKTNPEELQQRIVTNEQRQAITNTSGRGLAMITNLWTDEFTVAKSEWGGIMLGFKKKIETTPPPQPPAPALPIMSVPSALLAASTLKGPVTMFLLKGEMDSMSMENVTTAVEKQIHMLAPGSVLALDFRDVSYINSTFIGYLASWYNEIAKKGGAIQLTNANDQIKDVINLVGLNRIMPLH